MARSRPRASGKRLGLALAAMGVALLADGARGPAQTVAVGRGSYCTVLPPGRGGPSEGKGRPATPCVVGGLTGPVPTNNWWSSLVWKRRPDQPFSENLYAHPMAFRAKAEGLGASYPTHIAIDPKGRNYHRHYAEDLVIGVAGLTAKETRVEVFSDWAVTARWEAGGRRLSATIGHGMPYVYCDVEGGEAVVSFRGRPKLDPRAGGVLAATVNGHHYALFAPSGAAWEAGENAARSSLNGKGWFSVALLPDEKPATLELFRRHAAAFVTGTRVSWRYEQAAGRLVTSFELTTRPREGTERRPLIALYRHQWLCTQAKPTGHSYASSRGEMKLLAASAFETVMPFHGVLPGLPGVGTGQPQRLRELVQEAAAADKPIGTKDTYWTGKELGRLASLAHVADQAGLPDVRDRFLDRIQGELDAWLTAGKPTDPRQFHYEPTWGTLIGFPASYGSDTQLNDHNFHYGYYVMAAAAVARFRPDWARAEKWGGMVELLIRDCANWDPGDRRFPRLRCFDPYAGHSWASGHAAFAAGNNQESSSEALNFAAACVLWGAATGNQAVRDLGVFLYATETRAVQQYWFDVDRAVFPEGFRHSCLGILWSNGGAYATWWTANPEEIHGINFLPITGASLYLGRRADYVRRNYDDLVATNGGPEEQWRDIIWSFQALADPAAVAAKLDKDPDLKATSGMSRAHTYQWIHALAALGQVDTTVTADVPTYAVFRKGDGRTHVALNPGPQPITVTFSDGMKIKVAANSLRCQQRTNP